MPDKMNDSQLLEMLAMWFDVEHKRGRWPDSSSMEVQNDLRRIAKKMRHIETNFDNSDLNWPDDV